MESETYRLQDRGSQDAYASYFAGMDASMQQKVALTTAHFPTTGRVADMGSGSGRGTFDLACLHPDLDLVGVDINPAAVASAHATYQRSNLRYLQGDIADPVFPPESLDGILDSSVLHHVTSFTGYSTDRLEACLDNQVAALRPGGVLIIRDFVAPDGPEDVALDVRSDDGQDDGDVLGLSTWALWRRYAFSVRNSRYQPGELRWKDLGVPEVGWHRLRCRHHDAQEFLLRKDYRADWEVELLEEYTYWTQAEFIHALERRSLRMVVAAPIRNPWIIANRYQGRARLFGPDGGSLPFPPTNMVVVGQKTVSGQGTRLRLVNSAPVDKPVFLHLQTWTGSDGSIYDLVERPGRTLDLLPWFRRNGQVLVLAKQGFPRPIVVADPLRPNLSGAQWSGYLAEPIAAITAPDSDLPRAVRTILRERAGVDQARIRAILDPSRYATSPGGIDEIVTAVPVEIDPDGPHLLVSYGCLAEAGSVHVLDARACLRAAQVGGLFDARLELNIHRLLRRLGVDRGPWIGAAITPANHHISWPRHPDALRPSARITFTPAAHSAGYLDIRSGLFSEVDANGRELATTSREWVVPRSATSNTAVVLPIIVIAGDVLVGVEHRWLPAIQSACGSSGLAVVPAWRLPAQVDRLDRAESWLREQFLHDHGSVVGELIELGGPYLATPGATPELVHPWVAIVEPAHGPGRLHWTPLRACLEADLLDAHLAIAVHRVAQALGDMVQA
jgi:SAM-dependent methyltransferase